MMLAQGRECAECHWVVPFKMVDFMAILSNFFKKTKAVGNA